MADADVRAATVAEAADIARIQVSTWRTAYSELLPAESLDALDTEESEHAWREAIREDHTSVLIAVEGSWTVGFCVGGPAPEAEAASAEGEKPNDLDSLSLVGALLVEPRWGRRGHGGRLLGTLARRLGEAGATRAITWIPEADQASMAFFRSVGWEPDGTVRTLDAGGRPLRELRLSGGLDLRFEHT